MKHQNKGALKSVLIRLGKIPFFSHRTNTSNEISQTTDECDFKRQNKYKAVNAEVISLKDAPRGYAEFGSGAAKSL
jgi:hypothetical protein